MATKEYKAERTIVYEEEGTDALYVIAKGSVKASFPGGELQLGKGDVIGACEIFYDSHFISYAAETDTTVASYPCTADTVTTLLSSNKELAHLIITSLFRQLKDLLAQYETLKTDSSGLYQYLMNSYSDYIDVCQKNSMQPRALPALDDVSELSLEEDVGSWMNGYYVQMNKLASALVKQTGDTDFLTGLLYKGGSDAHDVIAVCLELSEYQADIAHVLMNENHVDLFDLYSSVVYKIGSESADSALVMSALDHMMMQASKQPAIDQTLYEQRIMEYQDRLASADQFLKSHGTGAEASAEASEDLKGSLETILHYADCEEEVSNGFRKSIAQFKKLQDKNDTGDAARKLRLQMAKQFYQIYKQAFLKSVKDWNVPRVLMMFFNFGYVDEELAGAENAAYLYSIADVVPSDPAKHVYTIYEWLKAIYEGQKVPSRNEFDNDYTAYVHELKVTGKITPSEETKMLADREERVNFEIDNMFTNVNKMTFGRISTFCPVFSEHDILKDLSDSLVSAEKIEKCFSLIRSTDFGAFYRDTVYTNPDMGIAKEYLSVEVLPDVILMPNIGVRGVMWQEIEGRKRTTPARMMVSVFQMEDLTGLIVRMTGEYRWEMCKRIQGARWNDVSEPSLTSEYFDYIQFYKKNRDLSADAKDKIKLSMQKAKNSFKEMFIRDYCAWILYEGTGSPRLNKVARNILFTYCPFSKEIRDKLKANPLYKEIMDRYDIKLAQKLHHMDNLFQKIKNNGAAVPDEIVAQRAFLES